MDTAATAPGVIAPTRPSVTSTATRKRTAYLFFPRVGQTSIRFRRNLGFP